MKSHLANHSPHKINVLIIEDHPLFREGLERALSLEEDILVVGFAVNGEEGLDACRKLRPDVVLLDVNLPGMNGMQVAQQLRSGRRDVAVVMLTAYHDSIQVLYSIRAGAAAYCAKNIDPSQLIEIIRDVNAGYTIIDGKRFNRNELDLWVEQQVTDLVGTSLADPEQQLIPLSPRETEILDAVANGMSNKEIASWLGISQQTVKNHMTSVLRKLNVEDRTQAAVTALRHGWVRIRDDKE